MELFILVIIIVVYVNAAKNSKTNANALFNKVLVKKGFRNIKQVSFRNYLKRMTADCKGENFIFEVNIGPSIINKNDIIVFYNYAKSVHIHNMIVVANRDQVSLDAQKEMAGFKIQLWDSGKLNSMLMEDRDDALGESTVSVLQTSSVSEDKCEIDSSKFDPIQEGKKADSIFSIGIFNKPDKL